MFSYVVLAEYKKYSCLNQHQTTHSSSTTAWRSKIQQGAVRKILLKEVTNDAKLALKSERAPELCPPIFLCHPLVALELQFRCVRMPRCSEDLYFVWCPDFVGCPRCVGEPRFGGVPAWTLRATKARGKGLCLAVQAKILLTGRRWKRSWELPLSQLSCYRVLW